MIVNYVGCCAISSIILAAEPLAAAAPEATPHRLAVAAPAAPDRRYGTALLRGLNKITAHVSILRAGRNRPIRFGTLEITVLACYRKPPEEIPESAVRLLIHEQDGEEIFSGWMFAGAPAFSTLDHPVYDIRLLDCDDPLRD